MSINPLPGGNHHIPQDIENEQASGAQGATGPSRTGANTQSIMQDVAQVLQNQGKQPVDDLPSPNFSASNVGPAQNSLGGLSDNNIMADINEIMALFQKFAQEMRTTARAASASAADAEAQAMFSAAEKISEAAEKRMIGAITSGALQIAGGVATAATAAYAGVKLSPGMSNAAASKIMQVPDAGKGAGAALGGIGTIVEASLEREASDIDAERARLEATAQVFRGQADTEKDIARQMLDVINDVRSRMDSMTQSREATNRDIARNI